MNDHAVTIAGAGPTGLMLAGELALAGVDVAVVERRHDQHVDGSRAGGLLARTIEVLDQRGIAERFLAEGQTIPAQLFAGTQLDLSDVPTRHPYLLALWQRHIERLLAGWVDELDVPILRGREVVGIAQDHLGVDVEISDGTSLRAGYLVGCDGSRSVVRRAAAIDFVGTEASTSWLIAEVEMDDEPPAGMRHDARGSHGLNRLPDSGLVRVVLTEVGVDQAGQPGLDELRANLVAVYGQDFGAHDATWISRFTDATRQAVTYRDRRVLVAGDAAHIHPPHGGQGLNTGVQDAVNLGWKLAQVVHGVSPDTLLDTYHDERHPVGAQALRNALMQVAMAVPDARHDALRDTMNVLTAMDEPRRYLAGRLSGLELRYDLGDTHPLLGRRMPDVDLNTSDGPVRAAALQHGARWVLLDLGGAIGIDLTPWAEQVRRVDASYDGIWELPVVGEVTAPAAVLIRPDGYVGWVGEHDGTGLSETLSRWIAPPTTPGVVPH